MVLPLSLIKVGLLTLLLGCTSIAVAAQHRPLGIGVGIAANTQNYSSAIPDLRFEADSLEVVRKQLELQRHALGPYSPALGERWLSAAEHAQVVGDYKSAARWFNAALHNVRINEGLNTSSQVSIVDKLLVIARVRGDRTALADKADYRFRLLGSGKAPFSEESLRAANEWLKTRTELLVVNAFDARMADYLYDAADKLQTEVCEDPSWREAWCRALSFRLLGIIAVIDWYVRPLAQDEFGEANFGVSQRYRQSWDQSSMRQRFQSLDSRVGSRARQIFDQWEKYFPVDDALALVRADWEWLNGRRTRALATYRELYARHADWFSQPVALPAEPQLSPDPRLADSSDKYSLDATITATGRIVDLEVRSDTASDLGAVRRQVRELRFRPALDTRGEPFEARFTLTVIRFGQ